MHQIEYIALSLSVFSTLVMIICTFCWFFVYFQYLSAKKDLKTLANSDVNTTLSEVSGRSMRNTQEVTALSESLEKLNAKLVQRWRREDREQKKLLNVNTPPEDPQLASALEQVERARGIGSVARRKQRLIKFNHKLGG